MLTSIYTKEKLSQMNIHVLRALGREVGVAAPTKLKKEDIIDSILAITVGGETPVERSKRGRPPMRKNQDILLSAGTRMSISAVEQNPVEILPQAQLDDEEDIDGNPQTNEDFDVSKDSTATGILEIMPDGYGFLRAEGLNNGSTDVYVPPMQIKRFSLRAGDKIECKARAFKEKQSPSLIYIFKINDQPCEQYCRREKFEDMISCYPNERLTLERDKTEYSLRLIDLVAPIGKGQRGLIVAAPKTGKTILLKKIAQAIRTNNPEIHLVVLLIDERPEEVTDFKQSVDCDVVYSTFDQSALHHIQTAELVINNAKRRVEQGQDCMILLDSITRLGRAYNQTAEQSGRTLTGGLDVSALQEPKKFFGAGRNVMGSGSLTILATALIDTGSRMDDIIYEEFKGTGNMEIHLDRRMSEKRIFPAIDLAKSGTRREEMLLTKNQLEGMWMIRRALSKTDTVEATEQLLDLLMTTNNNDEFINLLKVIAQKSKEKKLSRI
ncbi:MAG: transcription termination factor Rho [Clostridia bacterium]|nr:transcription termination factor Rho [Clostridia bacterium]